MDYTGLSASIARLPPLDRLAPFRTLRRCKICGREAIGFDRIDFNKCCAIENYYEFGLSGIDITYFRCLSCGFIFTEDFDSWSKEEFASLVYNQDYVKVDGEYVQARPARNALDFAARLAGCQAAAILDYGAGAGVFVDRMRDAGFAHTVGYDPFSSPERPTGPFDIITCFEVLEHSPDPIATLTDMRQLLRDDGCILFGQTVQPPDILSVRGNWWYLAPRNGHISTFSEEALVELGRHQDLVLHKGTDLYGFAPRFPSSFARHALVTVGPDFAVLRLLAPRGPLSTAIAFPTRDEIIWHPAEHDGIWRFRWTGARSVWWDASWGEVAALQIRVPVLQEIEPGFAARCTLEVGGRRQPVSLDRGELVAEFDVAGRVSGEIGLHLPEPSRAVRHATGARPAGRGVAVLLSQVPSIASA